MSLRTSAALRILCALVTLVCLSCDWSSPEAKKAKHRERAISYFEKSQYQEAGFEYQNVVQIDLNDADAHYRLGLTYLKLGGQSNLRQAFAALSRRDKEWEPYIVKANYHRSRIHPLTATSDIVLLDRTRSEKKNRPKKHHDYYRPDVSP